MSRSLPVPDIAARLIPAIGRAAFPGEILSAYRELAGCDYSAAFDLAAEDGPRVIFAEGQHPHIRDFAGQASRAYAARYWQLDERLHGEPVQRLAGGLALTLTSARDIPHCEYRRDCYEMPGVIERLALFGTGEGALLVTGYRVAGRGPATPAEKARIAAAGPALMAATRRHCELSAARIVERRAECYRAMMEKARRYGLSEREAHVASGLADGEGQADIARRCGIAVSSVVTYRKRAYRKLDVENRRMLRAFFEAETETSGSSFRRHQGLQEKAER